MLKKRFKYLFQNRRIQLLLNTLSFFGFLWLIVESFSFFVPDIKCFTESNYWLLISLLVISFISSIFYTLSKYRIGKHFTNIGTSINIVVGELLDQDGHIVIATSDYFDTITSRTSSLKTQLIQKHFNGAIEALDNQIETSLTNQNINGIEVNINEKPSGKTKKYNIGDTAIVQIPSKLTSKVFISVICKVIYDGNHKQKQSNYKMLSSALEKLWQTIRNENNNKDIYIPVLGAGVTGLSLSKLTLSQLIIMSYLLNTKNSKVGKSLTIVIPERNYDPELFELLDNFIHSFKI